MDHDEYLKRREELLDIRMDSFSSLDKAILTLSTGSLVLSVTFLEKIGKPFNLLTLFLILMAWAAFFLGIIFNLCSYWFARANMDRKIEELNRTYLNELICGREGDSPEGVCREKRATCFCNTAALATFFVGVLLFLAYSVTIQAKNYCDLKPSVEKEKTMADGKQQNLNEGKTEVPKAISKTIKPVDTIIKHGATEPPQAILRPTGPSGGGSGQPPKGTKGKG